MPDQLCCRFNVPGVPPPTATRVLRGHIGRFNADEVAAGCLPSPGLALLCAPVDLAALKEARPSRQRGASARQQRAVAVHSVVDIVVFRLIREKQGPRQFDCSFGLPRGTARPPVKDASERYGRIAGWTGEKQPGRHRQQTSTGRQRVV